MSTVTLPRQLPSTSPTNTSTTTNTSTSVPIDRSRTPTSPRLREHPSRELLRQATGPLTSGPSSGGVGGGNGGSGSDNESALRPTRSATAPALIDRGRPSYSHSVSNSSFDSTASSGTYGTTTTGLSSVASGATTGGGGGGRRAPTPPLYQYPTTFPTFHSYLLSWGPAQVAQFLALHRCSDYVEIFEDNHITGAGGVILEIGADELKEMGITRVGDRVRLLGAIRELKRRCSNVGGDRLGVGWSRGGWVGGSTNGGMGGRLQGPGTASSIESDFGSSAGGIEFRLNGESTAVSPAGIIPQDGRNSPHPFATSPTSPDGLGEDSNASLDRSRQGGPMRRLNAVRPPPLHLEKTSLSGTTAAPGTGTSSTSTSSGTDSVRQGIVSSGKIASSVVIPLNVVGPMGMASARSTGSSGSGSGSGGGSNQVTTDSTSSSPSNYSNDTVKGGSAGLGAPNMGGLGMTQTAGSVPPPVGLGSRIIGGARSPSVASPESMVPPSQPFGRRSPSPALVGVGGVDPLPYLDRPLPPAPAGQSTDRKLGTPALGMVNRSHGVTPNPDSRAVVNPAHRKTGSVAATIGISPTKARFFSRSGSTGGSNTHPYASPMAWSSSLPPMRSYLTTQSGGHGSGSPTKDAFGMPAQGLQTPMLQAQDDSDISPSREAFHGGSTTPTMREPSGHSGRSGSGHSGPDVPMTARLRAESTDIGSPSSMSLDDVRRRTVKFINGEDGTTRVINFEDCEAGVEVLEKALRKFGKWRKTGEPVQSSESEGESDGVSGLEVDGWGVYLEGESKPLSEAALLALCHERLDDPSRGNGLILRRSRKLSHRKNIEGFLGEAPPLPISPKSPTYFPGPRLGTTNDRTSRSPTKNGAAKQMNRASTVSIMSGLGVPMSNVIPLGKPQEAAPAQPSIARISPSTTGSFLANRGKKMYNFFGHRPPSELIASHLADYFPSAKRKELEKTARNSMIRLSTLGDSSTNRTSYGSGGDKENRPQSRFSVASSIGSSSRMSRGSSLKNVPPPGADPIPEDRVAEDVPQLSVSSEYEPHGRHGMDGDEMTRESAISQRPPLLPALVPESESLSDSLKVFSPKFGRPPSVAVSRRGSGGSTRSRLSTLSAFRRNRRKSDAASMLTVDEITAEVERRRASVITFAESEDEEGDGDDVEAVDDQFLAPRYSRQVSDGLSPGLVPQGEGEDEDEEDVFEEDESEEGESSEEEEEEEQEPEDEEGKKYTSTGSKRSIKWMKGALLGAGSFGQVFLGLDAQSGVLMAVKQVELGETDSGHGAERRKGMIVALEREIELLKDLQHEHIVQYLDSSTDAHHLNIFLEYVPGGTVASLLNKYGPFEEALVQRWIKQTLTGLDYLHQRDIIHRDIKGANILVDNKGGIKIADFGISKKIENNLLSTRIKSTAGRNPSRQSLQGSVFWMAPEVVKQTSYTKKADIWSVGCLVVEMLTGQRPWPDLTQMQALFRIGSSAKPSIPGDISSDAVDFLTKTFEIDHTKRPYADELLEHPFIVRQ